MIFIFFCWRDLQSDLIVKCKNTAITVRDGRLSSDCPGPRGPYLPVLVRKCSHSLQILGQPPQALSAFALVYIRPVLCQENKAVLRDPQLFLRKVRLTQKGPRFLRFPCHFFRLDDSAFQSTAILDGFIGWRRWGSK